MNTLTSILEFLESNLNHNHLQKVHRLLAKNIGFQETPSPIVRTHFPYGTFSSIPYSQAVEDYHSLLYNELVSLVTPTVANDCSIPMVRANYGVGILPSLFGLQCTIINNSMPWVQSFESIEQVIPVLHKGVPSLNTGLGAKVFEAYQSFNEELSPYPLCKECIKLYHPDLQSPFDAAHLMLGSDIYMEIYDNPQLIQELLALITDTYIAFMEKLFPLISPSYHNCCYHWRTLYGGNIVLRNDSAVNLSRETYNQLVRPFDQKILNHFGGGSVHYCGRADQLLDGLLSLDNLKTLNFGYMENAKFDQAYLQSIYPRLQERCVSLSSYYVEPQNTRTFDFERFKVGINFTTNFDDQESAFNFLQSINFS